MYWIRETDKLNSKLSVRNVEKWIEVRRIVALWVGEDTFVCQIP